MKKLMGETLNPRDIDEILRDGDLNGDGLVDFEGTPNAIVIITMMIHYITKRIRSASKHADCFTNICDRISVTP